jgi:N-acyl-D-aspartate/D-glutamate deacylase
VLDLLIKNALVIDGTGRPAVRGNLGVSDGCIEAVGDIDGLAKRTIDATDLAVAPGFCDVHTHYDAQVMWDPTFSPSPLHGVTTVLGGNCGFTVAPYHGGSDYILKMLARVEGMPVESLESSLDWNWRSFGDWLDRLEGNMAVNAGFLVGHSALRVAAMGERAVGSVATHAEIDAMVTLLHDSIEEGGIGFSTTRATPHVDHNGDPVPSRWASEEEFLALAAVAGSHAGTSLEMVPDIERVFSSQTIDFLVRMAVTSGRPLNWNMFGVRADDPPEVRESRLAASDLARAQGAKVVALTLPIAQSSRKTLLSGTVYQSFPGWKKTMQLPLSQLREALSRPSLRRDLEKGAAQSSFTSTFADWANTTVLDVANPDLLPLVGRRIGDIAAETNRSAFDTFLDIAIDDSLLTGFSPPFGGDDEESWQLRSKYWRDNRIVIGGSDAGAHVDQNSAYNCYSSFIGPIVRDRKLVSLEEAVHLSADVPARLYGLVGRGRIELGWHADLVIFDPQTVAPLPVRHVHDLPGGAMRLFGGAMGIESVFVNGTDIVSKGAFTGEVPGTVLRSGRATA